MNFTKVPLKNFSLNAVNSYNDAVDEYDDLDNKYDRAINEYDDLIAEYNVLSQSFVNTNSKTSSQNSETSKSNSSSSVVLKTNSTSPAAPKTDAQSSTAQKTDAHNPTTPKDNSQETNSHPGTFTIGSSEDIVKSVMGTPSEIIGDTWSYGFSSVYFGSGVVSGWSIIDKKLNVYMGEKISSATFTVGSSKDEVVKAMGTPSEIIGDTWSYGFSSVYFRSGVVSSWSEIDVKLNVP